MRLPRLFRVWMFWRGCALLCSALLWPTPCRAQEVSARPVVADRRAAGDFRLAEKQRAAPLYTDAADFPVVQVAAEALAADPGVVVQRVTLVRAGS